jgi:hypothetical protein
VPFFSDELFRWTQWDEKGKTGWGRSIKYSIPEYKALLLSVEKAVERLGIGAADIEKVAYVLGKEGVDVDEKYEDLGLSEEILPDGEGEDVAEGETLEKEVSEEAQEVEAATEQEDDSKDATMKSTKKNGAKRKAQEETTPAEGTRRSTRRKM